MDAQVVPLANILADLLSEELVQMEEELDTVVGLFIEAGGMLMGMIEDDDEDFNFDVQWEKVEVDIDRYRRMGDPFFQRHFRLTKPCFELLLLKLANHLVVLERLKRIRTPMDVALMTTLWVLSHPDTFRSVALRFGVQPGTVHFHYSYIIEALREMAPQFIRWPDQAERLIIQDAFEQYSGIPGIVGVLDGTYNVILAPIVQKLRYRNRHHQYSLNTQVVCDHTLLIRDVYIGSCGSTHDKRMLRRSPLFPKLVNPTDDFLSPGEHVIGDGAYTLMDTLIVPFRNLGNLTPQQRRFYYCVCRPRARIEHTFARSFGQWRRMKYLPCINIDLAVDHIMACFVLHNFSILNGEELLDSTVMDNVGVVQYLNEMIDFVEEGEADEIEEEDAINAQRIAEAQALGVEKRWDIVFHL